MKLEIVCDGTAHSTKIIDIETGEKLENVISVDWRASAGDDGLAVAHITLVCSQLRVIGVDEEICEGAWTHLICTNCDKSVPTIRLNQKMIHSHDIDECVRKSDASFRV